MSRTSTSCLTERRPPAVVAGVLFMLAGSACSDTLGRGRVVPGDGTIGNIDVAANDAVIQAPLDATPSPDGKTIYFTALESTAGGDEPGVFKVAAAGGSITTLAVGLPLEGPFGITVNSGNTQVYVADTAAGSDATPGAVYAIPTSGGTPVALSGTAGYAPVGVVLVKGKSGDLVYFTGADATTALPGLFRVSASGGSVTTLATGAPFVDPSGLAVAKNGNAYVIDTLGSGSLASVLEVSSTATRTLVGNLGVGYPAGIALSQDEAALLVSGRDPVRGTDVVYRIVIATGSVSRYTEGIDAFVEPAGLHRALDVEVYAWADSEANGTGTVFVLTP